MKLGDTFKLERNGEGHLWVVISEPTPDGSVIMVSLTTFRPTADSTCLLSPGDHPFVVHATTISYQHARLVPLETQRTMEAQRQICIPREPMSRPVLERIRDGALKSDLMPQKLQAILRFQLSRVS